MSGIIEVQSRAFKNIQDNPVLYKKWHECFTERERQDMIAEQVWAIAYQEGYDRGVMNCQGNDAR